VTSGDKPSTAGQRPPALVALMATRAAVGDDAEHFRRPRIKQIPAEKWWSVVGSVIIGLGLEK
jgi:hypothetical protein